MPGQAGDSGSELTEITVALGDRLRGMGNHGLKAHSVAEDVFVCLSLLVFFFFFFDTGFLCVVLAAPVDQAGLELRSFCLCWDSRVKTTALGLSTLDPPASASQVLLGRTVRIGCPATTLGFMWYSVLGLWPTEPHP